MVLNIVKINKVYNDNENNNNKQKKNDRLENIIKICIQQKESKSS